MRRVLAILGLIALFVMGAAIGSAPASSGSGQSTTPTDTSTAPATTTNGQSTTPTDTSTTPATTTATTPPPPTIPQPTGHPLNNNTVENSVNGTVQARSKFQAAHAGGNDADPVNFAYAYAHDCTTGCVAVAAAFQVALIDQGTHTQTPQNIALALNYDCTHCGVFAYAYQYAVDVPKGTHLPSSTHQDLASIRGEAAADVAAGLPFAELDSRLRALGAKLRAAVDDGLADEKVNGTHKRSNEHREETGGT